MKSVSTSVFNAIHTRSRYVRTKIVYNSTDIMVENLKTSHLSSPSGGLTFGTVAIGNGSFEIKNATTDLLNKRITVYFGVMVSNLMEWVSLGQYTVYDVSEEGIKTTYFFQDDIAKLDVLFDTELTYPANITSVLSAIATTCGVTFDITGVSGTISTDLMGFSCRDIVAFIGQMLGCFAYVNVSNSKIGFTWYTSAVETINSQNYLYMIDEPTDDGSFSLGKISCVVGAENLTAENSTYGTGEVSISNPLMTQDILDAVFDARKGFTYNGSSVYFVLGNPLIDPWDTIQIEYMGKTLSVPCMSIKNTFAGGITTEIQSFVRSENEAYKGTITKELSTIRTSLVVTDEKIESVVTEVSNIQVGARNLVVNTLYPNVNTASDYPHILGQSGDTNTAGTVTTATHGIRVTLSSQTFPRFRFGASSGSMNGLTAGSTYTFSFDTAYKLYSGDTDTTTTRNYVARLYTDATGSMAITAQTVIAPIEQSDKGVEKTGRCVFTFTVPTEATQAYLYVLPATTTSSLFETGDYVEMSNIMLEVGNKATSWTPAPEDYEATFAFQQSQITQNSDNITAEVTARGNADNDLQSQITINANGIAAEVTDRGNADSALQSQITANATNINLKVSKDSVISEINQSAEQIQIQASKVDLIGQVTFSDLDTNTQSAITTAGTNANAALTEIDNLAVGGRNLMLNTYIPNVSSAANRPHILGQSENTTGRTFSVATHGVRVTSSSAQYPFIRFGANSGSMNGLTAGETYTFSFDTAYRLYSGDTGTTTVRNYVVRLYTNATGSMAVTAALTIKELKQADKGVALTGRCEFTFTVPAAATAAYLYVLPATTTASLYAAGDYVEMSNIMLEVGNTPSGWSPAPEDIAVQNVYTTGTTTIDGGKITTGSITAAQINVSDLFAQNISMTGQFTATGRAFLQPTETTVTTIHDLFIAIASEHRSPTAEELALYDLNNDGNINSADIMIAKRAFQGEIPIDPQSSTFSGWAANYCAYFSKTDTLSDITVTIYPANADSAFVLTGVDVWGETHTVTLGINGFDTLRIKNLIATGAYAAQLDSDYASITQMTGCVAIYVRNSAGNTDYNDDAGLQIFYSDGTDIDLVPLSHGLTGNIQEQLGEVIYTGTLLGGDTLSLDVSTYRKLRIYYRFPSCQKCFDLDLSVSGDTTIGGISGYDPHYACDVTETADYVGQYVCMVSVNAAKDTITVQRTGYRAYSSMATWNDRSNNNSYYIYRIEGVK